MKKTLVLILLLLLVLLAAPALAEEAKDLSADCKITVSSKGFTAERLTDRDYRTYWAGDDSKKTITIKCPEAAYGLYLCFMENPKQWSLEQKVGGKWQQSSIPEGPYKHVYLPLDGASEIRIKPEGKNKKWFGLLELFVLGQGEVPDYVQRWQQTPEDCDLLVLFAHPDDEALFFGGTIPVYAGEKQMAVVACVLSYTTPIRVSELLNSLWTMGMKTYPVVGPIHDSFSSKLEKAYDKAGERKVKSFVVELFRKYKPEVVVTHDVKGEYGHGMHMMCADAALYAFDKAGNASTYADSAKAFGTWQASKLYLHLYPKAQLEMDWDQPLAAFSGRTGFEVALLGYDQHKSQHRLQQYKVEPRDAKNSSYQFGLARTTVGDDKNKNDFFENVTTGSFQVDDKK